MTPVVSPTEARSRRSRPWPPPTAACAVRVAHGQTGLRDPSQFSPGASYAVDIDTCTCHQYAPDQPKAASALGEGLLPSDSWRHSRGEGAYFIQ